LLLFYLEISFPSPGFDFSGTYKLLFSYSLLDDLSHIMTSTAITARPLTLVSFSRAEIGRLISFLFGLTTQTK